MNAGNMKSALGATSLPTRPSVPPAPPSSSVLWDNQRRFLKTYSVDWDKKVLGQGSFGVVLSGLRVVDKKPIAVKFICKEDIRLWKKMTNSFRGPKEAYFLEKVNHVDGVIRVYEFMELGEYFAIIMERIVDSETLHHHIEKNGTLDEDEARNLTQQLLNITSDCLKEGVVHRDLKSDNILIDKKRQKLAVIDFGCGAIVDDPMVPLVRFNGGEEVCPPEWIQYRNYFAEPGTVWSLGVLLYYMTHGYAPFGKESEILEAKLKIGNGVTVSPELKDFLRQCFKRDFKQRARLRILQQHPWITKSGIVVKDDTAPSMAVTLRRSSRIRLRSNSTAASDPSSDESDSKQVSEDSSCNENSGELPRAKRARRN